MAESRSPGIIDTIGEGFSLVNRHLWLVLLIIPLDLALWLGPRISISPLVGQAQTWYRQQLEQVSSHVPPAYAIAPQQVEQFSTQAQEGLEALKQFNLSYILAWQMPSLLKEVGGPTAGSIALSVESWQVFLALLGLLAALSLLGACFYRGAIAQFVRGNHFDGAFYLQRLAFNWGRLTLFFLLFAAALLLVGLPLLVMLSLMETMSSAVASFFTALGVAAALWFLFYLFFVQDAIFVGDVGTLRAVHHSFNIVRRNFWPALGLVLLVVLITMGVPLLWKLLVNHKVGLVAAMLGHAYIATGLAAASMVFYRDRLARWQQNLEAKGPSSPPP